MNMDIGSVVDMLKVEGAVRSDEMKLIGSRP